MFVVTSYGSTEFYSAASQILPVMLIALVLEARVLRRQERRNTIGLIVTPIVVGSFIVGEIVCLHALFIEQAHRGDQVMVVAALVAGTLAICFPVAKEGAISLWRQPRPLEDKILVPLIWLAVAGYIVWAFYFVIVRY